MLASNPQRAEHDFLLSVVAGFLSGSTELRGNCSDCDWKYLTEQAAGHRVIPLLDAALSRLPEVPISPPEREVIRNLARVNAIESLRWSGELMNLLSAFEREGIHGIPYKGPVLAAVAYGDIALREIGDLDILVLPVDVDAAGRLLERAGYASTTFATAKSLAHRAASHHHTFVRPDGAEVELHWNIVSPNIGLAVDYEGFFRRAEHVRVGGVNVSSLRPDDLLTALAIHGYQHAWRRLSWIVDIAALVETTGTWDWQVIAESSRAAGLSRIVAIALRLARDLAGATVHDNGVLGLDTAAVTGLAGQVRGWIFPAKPGFTGTPSYHWRARGGGLRGISALLASGFEPGPQDWKAVPLPGRLHFAYRLIRPVRLLGNLVHRSLPRVKRNRT